MKKALLKPFALCLLFFIHLSLNAQVPTCGSNVPFYQVNLVGQPNGSWVSPLHSRVGNCCGTVSPDNCTSFEILLDSNTAMIQFDIESGAIPTGVMYYQIGCGTQTPVGQPICLSGPGPHHLTFCKPGNNTNTYRLTAIAEPVIPPDQTTRIGCSLPIEILGLNSLSITSVYPGVTGEYDSYLSCINCANPVFTPAPDAPAYVDYLICGNPEATLCGYVPSCDTMRIYIEQSLVVSASPNPASFCEGGGALLTASASGGNGDYSFTWYNNSMVVVGTDPAYFATQQGTYLLLADDGLSSPTCPADSIYINVISDTQNPEITCPPTLTVNADAGSCSAASGNFDPGIPVTSDNCQVDSVYNNAPAVFPAGLTTITWTVTDGNNNSSSCLQDIFVIDTEDPVIISCSPSMIVSADAGQCSAVISLTPPTASDNCSAITITNDAPSQFNTGITTVTWVVTDSSGNSSSCIQVIEVIDSEAPVFTTCPSSIDVNTDPGICGALINYTPPAGTDNCPGSFITLASGLASGSVFPTGTTTVTYELSDAAGNTTTCSFDVTVTDNEVPVVICPPPAVVTADPGQCTAEYDANDLGTPAISDNCGIETITNNAPEDLNIGTTIITWTITDIYGNSSSCDQTVTVNDTEAPQVICCSPDTTINTDPGVCHATNVSLLYPVVTDNCSFPAITNDAPAIFPVGTTVVTWTIADSSGNISICQQNVTVVDNEAPVIVFCPSDIYTCNDLVTYHIPGATDNCGIATVTLTAGLPSGSIFHSGTTTIEYTITDIHGNSSTTSFTITVLDHPQLTYTDTDVSCFGMNDGSIDLTVIAGDSPFTFDWSNGMTTEDLSLLGPGTYTVTVTDSNGCSSTLISEIREPAPIILTETHTDITCFGYANGHIDVTVSGGIPPYTYSWNNGKITEDIAVLTGGIYILTVTDFNGCQEQISITVSEPSPLAATSVTEAAICSSPSGSVDIAVTGGNGNYSFSWSNGESSEDIFNLTEGNYTVIITDSKGCTFVLTDSVEAIAMMELQVSSTDVRCNTNEDGIIDITMLNGTQPFQYQWSNGAITEDLNNIPAGNYSVTVTDVNGCTVSHSFIINEPDPLTLSVFSPEDMNGFNVSYYNGSNGSIEATAGGGTEPYSFQWSSGESTSLISNLAAGYYSVLLTDANGCTRIVDITLHEPLPLEMPTGYSPNSDGQNDVFVVRGIEAYPENELQVYNRWGNLVYQQKGYSNNWDGRNNSGEELPDGTYFVVVVLKNTEPLTGFVDMRRSR